MNSTIGGFSPIYTQSYTRPAQSAGAENSGPSDSVGSTEPGGLTKRPFFAATSEATEGQRSSVRAGRGLVTALALSLVCLMGAGCATVHQGERPAPVAATNQPVAKQLGSAARDWHENVDKPVGKAVKETVFGIGHWWRDRAKEFKDGVQGK